MIKLIYSDDFDPIVGVGAQIVDKDNALKKQASTIFGCDYSDMKPDKDHVGIHVVALGDHEHYGCFFEGAPVSTLSGQKPIEDIKEGDLVLTHKGNYKKVLKTFTSLYTGNKATISVSGLPHDIECTENHPFLVVTQKGLSPASRFKLRNAGILKDVFETRVKEFNWVEAKDLEPGMWLVIPTKPSDEELAKYEDIPDEFDPYVAGFYLAEGCLVREHKDIGTKGAYHRVLLTGSVNDGASFEYVDSWLSSLGRIVPKRQHSFTSEYGVRYEFGYKEFALWLDTMFGHNAEIKHLHPQLYKWSNEQILNFLAGYFDGDGCSSDRPGRYAGTITASTASRTLAMDIQRLLAYVGIPSSVCQCWNRTSNGCFGHKDFPIYSINVGSFYSNIIREHTLRHKPHSRKFKQSGASSGQLANSYVLFPITDVQLDTVENVQRYNFEVEEDNSYVVDTIVHNCNRNNDSFKKEACIKYHDTFVKFGHVYRHHRNKDPQKSIGIIKASAYNDKMGRIELYIHADREKAAPELERLEKEGEHPMSMACSVKEDVCSICSNHRKQAGDESECEHIRNHFGDLMDDGRKVFTYNPEPQFFDISFVGRPADRIAWNLKIASGLPVSSVKQAEYEGITAPDELAITDPTALRKLDYLKQLSDYQKQYTGWATKSAAVITTKDRYLWELRKVAASSLDSETIESLRRLPPKLAFSVLGNSGVIMDVPTFFKYAMGPEYDTVKEYIPGVSVKVASIIEDSVDNNDCQKICNDTTFDTDLKYRDAKLENKLASAALTNDLKNKILIATIDNKIPNWNIDKRLEVCSNGIIDKLAEKYAAYELSAIDAVLQGRNDITQTIALTATHNLQD